VGRQLPGGRESFEQRFVNEADTPVVFPPLFRDDPWPKTAAA
jgi:hypothetical protein